MASNLPSDNLDRISNLPKEVTDEILKRIPIREAVQTSLLSSSWRYKWISVPELVFDQRSIPSSVDVGKANSTSLVNFVNNVLLLHNGNFSKFEVNNFLKSGCSDVDRWILVSSRKMLKHLVLVFHEPDSYQVPTCLFACENLTALTLKGCSLSLPSHYKGFSYLRRLVLEKVKLTSETVENLVVKCTLLLDLTVLLCTPFSHLSIHAPELIKCRIRGDCDGITFQNTPKLISADLSLWHPSDFKPTCRLNKVLGGVVNIRSLNIYGPFVEVDAAKILEITYHGLKDVMLEVNHEDSKQILAILCLCRSAPNLKKIEIDAYWNRSAVLLFEEHFWEGRVCKEGDILHHLKTVSMTKFKGVPHELGFVEFILLNALALETLSIEWVEGVQMNKELLHTLVKMMQFKRASSEVNVLFSGLP